MSKEGIRTIRRKGGLSYKAYVEAPSPDGRRNQLTKTFTTEAEAVKWRIATQHEINSGVWVDETDYDLKTCFELYVQARVVAGSIGENTIIGQRSAMRAHFGPLLDLPVKQVTPLLIEGALARERGRGISGSTLNKGFTILRSCLRWVVSEQGWLARNPTDKVRIPVIDTPEKTGWSLVEMDQFLGSAYGSREFPLWATLLGAGLRRGEAQALRWDDLLFDDHALRVAVTMTRRIGADGRAYKVMGVHAKTAAAKRLVPMMPDLEAILREHKTAMKREALLLGIGWDENRHVFSDDTGLSFIPDAQLDSRFKAAIARSGVRRLSPHELRHTFGSRAVGMGVPLPQVMKWMGHTKIETARRYQHPDRSEELRDMRRLGEVFRLLPPAAVEEAAAAEADEQAASHGESQEA